MPPCSSSEFVSYRPTTEEEVDIARAHGMPLDWPPETLLI
ncbi:hypothetical protein SAMN05444414_11499 [Roseovarius marisflavi]|uniref:Uncharacterized protein n=1 Tax=Roseovarius marisflavi TaxID=1054996 RepID=A0A1M7AR96_9RHOB|nr:hypothetical protein SAMN05444414_11499 [Roseovarius marisflavi]